MLCDQVREHFIDFLTDNPDQKSTGEIQDHLQNCAECREQFKELQTMWTTLGLMPEESPSEALPDRFDALLATYERGSNHKPRNSVPFFVGFRSHLSRRLVYGFALVVLLLAGVGATNLRSVALAQAKELARQVQIWIYDLRGQPKNTKVSHIDEKESQIIYHFEKPVYGIDKLVHPLESEAAGSDTGGTISREMRRQLLIHGVDVKIVAVDSTGVDTISGDAYHRLNSPTGKEIQALKEKLNRQGVQRFDVRIIEKPESVPDK